MAYRKRFSRSRRRGSAGRKRRRFSKSRRRRSTSRGNVAGLVRRGGIRI